MHIMYVSQLLCGYSIFATSFMTYHEILTSDGFGLSTVVDFGSSYLRAGVNALAGPMYCAPPFKATFIDSANSDFHRLDFSETLFEQELELNSDIDDCLLLSNFVKHFKSSERSTFAPNKRGGSLIPIDNAESYVPLPITIIPPRHFDKKKVCELLTELLSEFENHAVSLIKSPSANLFSVGKSSGIVIDSGAVLTCSTAVYDGYSLSSNESRRAYGGFTASRLLKLLNPHIENLCHNFYNYQRTSCYAKQKKTLTFGDELILKTIKRTIWDVDVPHREYKGSVHEAFEGQCKLPDGQSLKSGFEGPFIAELFFTQQERMKDRFRETIEPQSLADIMMKVSESGILMDCPYLPSMVEETLFPFDSDLQHSLRQTILTCGGALHPVKNVSARLRHGLSSLTGMDDLTYSAPNFSSSVCLTSQTEHSAWTGAAILSSIPDSGLLFITQKEVDEHGLGRILQEKYP